MFAGMSAFYTRIDKYPPVLVRLMARKPRGTGSGNGTKPLSTDEIAKSSGLSYSLVEGLSLNNMVRGWMSTPFATSRLLAVWTSPTPCT